MKTTLNLALIVFILLAVSCRSQKKSTNTEPVITMEDHASKTYAYPVEGVYYIYEFEEETPYDFDETTIIKSLTAVDIHPLDVWYKGGSSMCVPPGSDIGMTVIVPPGMLVRLQKESEKMAGLGFITPEEPHVGDCAYRVRHYQYGAN